MKRHAVVQIVAALVLVTGVAGAQQRRTPAPTPLPSKVEDSTYARRSLIANEAELLRMVNDIRAREASILQELERTPKDNEAARRTLIAELQNLNREAFTVMSIVEGRCIEMRATANRGYMGVSISSSVQTDGNHVVVSQSMIESVEPGSPADRAGLLAGDRLLSVGGVDTRNNWPVLASVLEPGRRIVVKVERQGQEVDLPLVVGERERTTPAVTCPQFERAMVPLQMGAVARTWVIDTTDVQGNRVVIVSPTPPIPRMAPATPLPATGATPAPPAGGVRAAGVATPVPTPAAPPMTFTYNSSTSAGIGYFGGAQIRALNDDWRSVLGVPTGTAGVLVSEVAPGSAAAQAGLRSGDVILQVNGNDATSPLVAVRLMGTSENRTATLRVMRARERRTVTMSWDR